jgi:sugar fermentation stimulation protein A
MPGTYILVIEIDHAVHLEIGRLGTYDLCEGYYLYVGSALSGLSSRVARHLRREKRLHWHIDYLLQVARVTEVWSRVGQERLECAWAEALGRSGQVEQVVRGFGSSDCECWSHLFYCAEWLGGDIIRRVDGARSVRLVNREDGSTGLER